ncbi:hypothetical protein GCM10010116_24620 [Microbispora rosea subsp. aerata]|nr:hypothetical protein [Microbispora rosea]GGO12274.1 hypothetical protein GCM10010116_24620 [Microbispora rosea subsp. aerata]GIH58621.1 hypothetical protein Mro02_55350 [Microbispora rosea subsp. aerata]GLJ84697.1 hypothetical protein GCM10017588_34250 [Microbispora rosea subsp. aerata]
MISLPQSRRAIIAMLCLPMLLAACTREPEIELTPEQSRQVFVTEAKAIIQAVIPDADVRVTLIDQDVPCGGPVGTDFSSVESSYVVFGKAQNETSSADEVFRKVLDVLKQRGWTINYTKGRVAGAERKGVGGFSVGIGEAPISINIDGTTECVDNPNR